MEPTTDEGWTQVTACEQMRQRSHGMSTLEDQRSRRSTSAAPFAAVCFVSLPLQREGEHTTAVVSTPVVPAPKARIMSQFWFVSHPLTHSPFKSSVNIVIPNTKSFKEVIGRSIIR